VVAPMPSCNTAHGSVGKYKNYITHTHAHTKTHTHTHTHTSQHCERSPRHQGGTVFAECFGTRKSYCYTPVLGRSQERRFEFRSGKVESRVESW
jgi:hypothetical protein